MIGRFLRLLAGLVLTGLAILAGAYWSARSTPVVQRTSVALADWPGGAPPITVALLSDIHLGNASMDRARLDRIVAQANALKPDLILLAGDYVAGYDDARLPGDMTQVAASLKALRAPLGVVGVLGNHDFGKHAALVAERLEGAGVTMLVNAAVARGPLAIGGLGDPYGGNARMPATTAAMAQLRGAKVMLMHSPWSVAETPGDIGLILTGHTHCGQVVLPFVGVVAVPSVPLRYICGVVQEPGRTIVISGGLGTSILPLRVHAPPDLWLVTLGPTAR